jgi:hypothetical protein
MKEYQGETCDGCIFKVYVRFTKKPYKTYGDVCQPCLDLVPNYIPVEQRVEYLKMKYEM